MQSNCKCTYATHLAVVLLMILEAHNLVPTCAQIINAGSRFYGVKKPPTKSSIYSIRDERIPPPTRHEVNGCYTDPGDPDTIRSVMEIIESRGYIAQEYDVVTKDGYILAIQRIINPLVDQASRARLKPVILQHGLMSSAADWVLGSVGILPALNEPNDYDKPISMSRGDSQDRPNSLGFYLANRGYDVFLANSRGNIYAQRHLNMTSWDRRFWNFTFDEKIDYDLPDTIEFVRRLTNRQKVAYVGHSQGAAMMFGLMSMRPEWADIVEPFIALAPVAYVNHALTPLRHLDFLTPYLEGENGAFTTNREIIDFFAANLCSDSVTWRDLCKNFIFLTVGFNEDELDPERIPALLCHIPSGTSLKNLAHYGQEIRSGRFARFDRGVAGNLLKYGRPIQPDYELGNIRSKSMVLFTAENDWLASPKDVAHLISSLTVEPYAWINMTEIKPLWNHIDFLYAKHTGQLINPRVHQFLEHFSVTT